MERRSLLKGAAAVGAVAGASSFPAPAIGQGLMEWRMVTSWPRNLPGPGVAAQRVADRIAVLTDGRITVNLSAAGEIVPALGVFDAVAEKTAELYHSVPAYWLSKSRGIGFFGSYPFGMTVRERDGWLKHGGGQALYDEIYGRFGLKPFNCGDSGPQWMGWFRRPIQSVDDFRGLRYRTAGLGGEMYRRVGAAVQTIPGGEIFGALQAGTIDAAEFVGPWSDFPLGFHQVAKYYYHPGVQEPSSAEEIGVNLEVWERLDDDLRIAIQAAADSIAYEVTTEYDTNHPRALRELVENHEVQVMEAPEDLIVALGEAARELTRELLEDSDELVRRIAQSYVTYRDMAAEYAGYSYAGMMNARIKTGPWS